MRTILGLLFLVIGLAVFQAGLIGIILAGRHSDEKPASSRHQKKKISKPGNRYAYEAKIDEESAFTEFNAANINAMKALFRQMAGGQADVTNSNEYTAPYEEFIDDD